MSLDHIFWVFLMFMCISCGVGASEETRNTEEEIEVERVVRAFYGKAVDYDYSGMRQQCSRDFIFEEGGHEWTLEQLILLLEHEKINHTLISHRIDSIDTKIRHPYAWIHFHNYAASFKQNDTVLSFRKVSAALKIDQGNWKLFRVESEKQFAKDSTLVM